MWLGAPRSLLNNYVVFMNQNYFFLLFFNFFYYSQVNRIQFPRINSPVQSSGYLHLTGEWLNISKFGSLSSLISQCLRHLIECRLKSVHEHNIIDDF